MTISVQWRPGCPDQAQRDFCAAHDESILLAHRVGQRIQLTAVRCWGNGEWCDDEGISVDFDDQRLLVAWMPESELTRPLEKVTCGTATVAR